jgi:hypothetical protein
VSAAPAGAADAWPVCVGRTAPIRTGRRELGRTADGRLLPLSLASTAMQREHRSHLDRADRRGRLHVDVDLGPSRTSRQTAFGPGATSGWTTVSVTVRPAAVMRS